jgi:uncharacterized RDD family membrane protein YckC
MGPPRAGEIVTRSHAGLVSRGIARAVDVTLLAVLVAGTGWLVQQYLGIDLGRCPEVREWWHLRARLCGFMPYAIPVAGVIIPPVYRVLFFTIAGQTPGMAVVGLRLLRADGREVGVRQAVKRVATFHLTLGLGSLLIPVSERRRALHDIVAGTVVVYDWGTHELGVRRAIEHLRSAGP